MIATPMWKAKALRFPTSTAVEACCSQINLAISYYILCHNCYNITSDTIKSPRHINQLPFWVVYLFKRRHIRVGFEADGGCCFKAKLHCGTSSGSLSAWKVFKRIKSLAQKHTHKKFSWEKNKHPFYHTKLLNSPKTVSPCKACRCHISPQAN